MMDSNIIRERICSRLITRKDGRSGSDYYRYKGNPMPANELYSFSKKLKNSEIFNV